MSNKYSESIYKTAKKNGCKPFWHDGIFGWAWHCSCTDLSHACDSQCSMIDSKSAKRKGGSGQIGSDPTESLAFLAGMGWSSNV